MKVKVKVSHVQLFEAPWTIQSKEFSRPEYWSGQPFPSPGDLPNPGIKLRSPALQVDSLPAEPPGSPLGSAFCTISCDPNMISLCKLVLSLQIKNRWLGEFRLFA